MRRTNPNPQPLFELELVEVVGDLGPTLPRKHVHAVVYHGHGKIAASRGAVPALINFLPLGVGAGEINGPHVVEACVTIIACENPQTVVKDGGTMGGTSWGEIPSNPVFPVDPLAGGELVLVEVVFVAEIRVGVDVSGVAAKDEHAVVEDNCRVMVAWGGRGTCVFSRVQGLTHNCWGGIRYFLAQSYYSR